MLIVIVTWVIFRAENLKDAMIYLGNMFGVGATGVWDLAVTEYLKGTAFILIVSCIGMTPFVKNVVVRIKGSGYQFIESIWLVLIFVLSLLQVVSSTYNPFIYFNF